MLIFGSVYEGHLEQSRRVCPRRQFTLSTVWRNSIGDAFITKSRNPSEDCPKYRFASRRKKLLFPLPAGRTYSTAVGLPIKLQTILPTVCKQFIDQTDNSTRGMLENPTKRFERFNRCVPLLLRRAHCHLLIPIVTARFRGGRHVGSVSKIRFGSSGQATRKASKPAPS
jgi:hypothetical protein